MRSRFSIRACSRLTPKLGRRGFTLPEILIVIVMISVLALVAVPRFAVANGRRHMQSARMRVAAAFATARAAAIQRGDTANVVIASNRVTVTSGNANLMSPVPLDTLYSVRVGGISDPYTVTFSARGFASSGNTPAKIQLRRPGVPDDSVVVTKPGMVQR
jgi:prepilin-type N-terminal cleavage/methylation domain-containing protein